MKNRDRKELKQIAIDLLAGKIFTDRHLPKGHATELCFMTLFFMSSEQIEDLITSKPGLIFEYVSNAAPRCCNGIPCFFLMQILNQHDTEVRKIL